MKSKLLIKNNATDSKDKLIWKFIKGTTSTTQADFANPETSAYYALCIYDDISGTPTLRRDDQRAAERHEVEPDLQQGLQVPRHRAWRRTATQKIIVKSSQSGKTKAILKGKRREPARDHQHRRR